MGAKEQPDGTVLVEDEDFKPEIQAEYKALHDLFSETFADRINSSGRGPMILFGMFLVRSGIAILLAQRLMPWTVAKNLALALKEVQEVMERNETGN